MTHPKNNRALCENIGRFVVLFSELEFVLHWTICAVLKPAAGERALQGAVDFGTKCTLAQRLLETVPPDETAAHTVRKNFFEKCRRMGDVRNEIAHGSWTTEGLEHVSRRSLKETIKFSAPTSLEKHIQELGEMSAEGLNLYVLFSPNGPIKQVR